MDHFRALADKLEVEAPVDALDVGPGMLLGDRLDPVRPDIRRELDRLQAQGRVGGDAPEAHFAVRLDRRQIEQPHQLLFPAGYRGIRIL